MTTAALSTAIREASDLLDPQHHGIQLPAPMGGGARSLPEQARALSVLLVWHHKDTGDPRYSAMSRRLWDLAAASE